MNTSDSEGHNDHDAVGIDRCGVVLAGGQSRRMGRDKARLDINGRSAVRRASEILIASGCGHVVQIGGVESDGLETIADRRGALGPLAGIETALGIMRCDAVAVIACDLIALQPQVIRDLYDVIGCDPEIDVAVAYTDRIEPLCGVWRRSTCAATISACLDAGERSVHSALEVLRVRTVPARRDLLLNVNTPGMLEQAATFWTMINEVTVDELAERLKASDGVRLVDVREVDEYVAGHVPGAAHLPLSELSERVEELRGPGPVTIVCQSGGRSMMACEFAVAEGIEAINVVGGTRAWIMSGREVTEGTMPG